MRKREGNLRVTARTGGQETHLTRTMRGEDVKGEGISHLFTGWEGRGLRRRRNLQIC